MINGQTMAKQHTPSAKIAVDRTQFLDGVRILAGMVVRKRQAKAVFNFGDGFLSVKIANTVIDVAASGEWPGSAKIGAQALFASISPEPSEDPINLTVEGNRMTIGRMSTNCEWIEGRCLP